MFGYYLKLALQNLGRNVWVTALMVLAISAGIGASMTTLALYRAMSGDPIPNKSHRLFVVQVDNWGPNKPGEQTEDQLQEYLSYIDARALMNARAAKRQTLIYTTYLKARANLKAKPVGTAVPAVYSDFFPMLDAPFKYGGPWSSSDDEAGAPVIVLSRKLNDKLFAGANSVGKTLDISGKAYRVVGVLDDWPLVPRFYDPTAGRVLIDGQDVRSVTEPFDHRPPPCQVRAARRLGRPDGRLCCNRTALGFSFGPNYPSPTLLRIVPSSTTMPPINNAPVASIGRPTPR